MVFRKPDVACWNPIFICFWRAIFCFTYFQLLVNTFFSRGKQKILFRGKYWINLILPFFSEILFKRAGLIEIILYQFFFKKMGKIFPFCLKDEKVSKCALKKLENAKN